MYSLTFLRTGEKGFRIPAGVAVDNRGRVYVSDTGYDAVFLFDADGRLIKRFGGTA